jgi:transcriptional regulator with XRE-family HTH domain
MAATAHVRSAGSTGYAHPVSQQRRETGFGRYLKEAILAARFPTPTHFARAAGTDPSVVLRWLSEEQRPTIRSLERIAPILKTTMNDLVLAAYPDRLAARVPGPPQLHPLARELDLMLAEGSRIPEADRHALESVLNRMLDPYRKVMRRRHSA